MNTIASFRKCTLSDDELLKEIDTLTDEMFKYQKVPTRNIPARPDEDYDLLIGELILRFNNNAAKRVKAEQLSLEFRSIISHALLGCNTEDVDKETWDLICDKCAEYAAQSNAGNVWEDVESAPKDGNYILGYDYNSDEIYKCWWNSNMGNGCWNCDNRSYIPVITKWQPLPSKPDENPITPIKSNDETVLNLKRKLSESNLVLYRLMKSFEFLSLTQRQAKFYQQAEIVLKDNYEVTNILRNGDKPKSEQVVCAICEKPITETGTDYKGKPVHIGCYHKPVKSNDDRIYRRGYKDGFEKGQEFEKAHLKSNDDWSALAKVGTPKEWLGIYCDYLDLSTRQDMAAWWQEQFNIADVERRELKKQKSNDVGNVEKAAEK